MPTLSNEYPSKNYLRILELASDINQKKIKPYLVNTNKILDFGAGEGSLTNLIKNTTNEVYAYEPSDLMRAVLSKKMNLNVIENLKDLCNQKFDVVIISSVVQYINPGKLTTELDQIFDLTNRVIIADVPNNKNYSDALSTIKNVILEKRIELFLRLLIFYFFLFVTNKGNSSKYIHNNKYFDEYCELRGMKIEKIKNIGLSNTRSSYLIEKND